MWLRKKEKVPEYYAIAPVSPPTKKSVSVMEVVKSIHGEFETAADKALEEARAILKEVDVPDDGMAEDLRSLGFLNHPLVHNSRQKSSSIAAQKSVIDTIEMYKAKYPNNSFVTKEKVLNICSKYGLVCGAIGSYRGNVPKKNIQEMLDFKVDPSDIFYIGRSHTYPFNMSDNVFDTHNCISKDNDGREVPWYICAPAADMIIRSNEMVVDGIIKEVPDPIVMQYVGSGFIVVTKWGPEANII